LDFAMSRSRIINDLPENRERLNALYAGRAERTASPGRAARRASTGYRMLSIYLARAFITPARSSSRPNHESRTFARSHQRIEQGRLDYGPERHSAACWFLNSPSPSNETASVSSINGEA
jgi:hypothetical protein